MKQGKAFIGLFILAFSFTILVGCGQDSPSKESYLGFKLENKVDLNDLQALDKTFIEPLYALNDAWFHDWNTPSEMKADEMIIACGMGNYLGFDREVDGINLNPYTVAEFVEKAVYERFGVAASQLKTSLYYNAKDNTYQSIDGGGGVWNSEAMSAAQTGDTIKRKIGIYHPSEGPVTDGDIKYDDGYTLTPKGTLTVELRGDYFKYVSYVLSDSSAASSVSSQAGSTQTVSSTAANALVSELSKGNLSVSGDLIAAFYHYDQRSYFDELRLLPDMASGEAPSWDKLTLFVHAYCAAAGISNSENQYLTTKDDFDRVISLFFSGLKYEHHSSEYIILKDDGYYPRGFDLPDSVYYRLTGLSKAGDIYTAKFDGFVICESEYSAAFTPADKIDSENVGQNMKAIMEYQNITKITNSKTVKDTMLEIFKKDDYAKKLRLDQKVEITFKLSGESEPALKYLSCHREYLTNNGSLPEVGS